MTLVAWTNRTYMHVGDVSDALWCIQSVPDTILGIQACHERISGMVEKRPKSGIWGKLFIIRTPLVSLLRETEFFQLEIPVISNKVYQGYAITPPPSVKTPRPQIAPQAKNFKNPPSNFWNFLKNIKNPPSEFREFWSPARSAENFLGLFAPENHDFAQNLHF